jgi:ribonuclease R
MKKRIIAFFTKNAGKWFKLGEIADELNITEFYAYSELREIVNKLAGEGFLKRERKKFMFNDEKKPITGVFEMSRGVYGFVRPDNPKLGDIFIHSDDINGALHGDIVEVAIIKQGKRRKPEGEIVRVIKRAKENYIGYIFKEKEMYFVKVEYAGVEKEIHIKKSSLNGAKKGDKVVVDIFEDPKDNNKLHAKVIEILGAKGEYDTELATLAFELKLPYKFPGEVIAEAESISDKISEKELKGRLDYRNKNVFTIDPEDAKDFDDALSIELLPNGNYSIGIHIADVSHYVKTGGNIFNEALKRGTSIYFVGKVIPMLPEHLSNKVCSLVPNEDRLTYSVIVEITERGRIIDYVIEKTIINSKRRFTYEEVQNILETGNGDFADDLLTLNKIARILRKNREKKGSINFSSTEVKFILDENNKPVGIVPKKINESNELVEDFMLLANQLVAKHVNKSKIKYDFIYRVHDKPEIDKVKEFARFVKTFGFSFDPNEISTPFQFQKLMNDIKGSDAEPIINDLAIRSMAKAIYSTENIGHYGLAFTHYTHFTSPIRRFPDLMVHKLIYNYINSLPKEFSLKQLEEYAELSSNRERGAQNAERISVKIKQVEFMEGKLGDEFDAVISGMTNFGMFIEIKDILVDGLIHLKDLDDDYYSYDERNFMMVGQKLKKKYKLGDKVSVKLIRVNKERRELNFILSS